MFFFPPPPYLVPSCATVCTTLITLIHTLPSLDRFTFIALYVHGWVLHGYTCNGPATYLAAPCLYMPDHCLPPYCNMPLCILTPTTFAAHHHAHPFVFLPFPYLHACTVPPIGQFVVVLPLYVYGHIFPPGLYALIHTPSFNPVPYLVYPCPTAQHDHPITTLPHLPSLLYHPTPTLLYAFYCWDNLSPAHTPVHQHCLPVWPCYLPAPGLQALFALPVDSAMGFVVPCNCPH